MYEMFIDQTNLEYRITAAQVALLADDDRDGIADAGVITAALTFGETTVKHHLTARYVSFFADWTTPATTPPVLTQLATDCAVYWLFSRAQGVVELWKTNYETALKTLQLLADGTQVLLGVDGTNYAVLADQWSQQQFHLPISNTYLDDPQFSRETLYNYMRNAPHLSEP